MRDSLVAVAADILSLYAEYDQLSIEDAFAELAEALFGKECVVEDSFGEEAKKVTVSVKGIGAYDAETGNMTEPEPDEDDEAWYGPDPEEDEDVTVFDIISLGAGAFKVVSSVDPNDTFFEGNLAGCEAYVQAALDC